MKKTLIAAIVGGLIIFIWQFLSYALINFHKPAQSYTDKQDAILQFLESQNLPEGGYVLPALPDNATMEDHEKLMKSAEGKPWVNIQYHKALDTGMIMNMIRGFIINIIIVWLFCSLIKKMASPTSGTIVGSALILGLIVFLNAPYTGFIWYKNFDIWAFFADAIVSWGLTGLWLAWYLRRGDSATGNVRVRRESAEAVS